MTEERIVKVTIDQSGATKVEGEGFQGSGCDVAVGEYAKALGAVTSDEKKPEYYQEEETSQDQEAGA